MTTNPIGYESETGRLVVCLLYGGAMGFVLGYLVCKWLG